MHKLKQHLRSLPFLAHFFQWCWDVVTISRFKKHHHSLIVKLEEEKNALNERCNALQSRIDLLEQNHAALSESLAPTVEKMVAEQIYYQSLALQQRIDQLGFDARILERSDADTPV